jgi:SAM-dependent methyltransferase
MTSAAQLWKEQLAGWGIPEEILAAAPESPWSFSSEVFRTRAQMAPARADTPTTIKSIEALPEGGSVLDVGCGSGATSLALAGWAGSIVGVDANAGQLELFMAAAADADIKARAIRGAWLEIEAMAPVADVAVCGHVAYNVGDLGPFAVALSAHASRRVVIEMTQRHPLSWMNDLWLLFHDLHRPDGPTAADAETVLQEAGIRPARQDHVRRHDTAGGGFENRLDAVALIRRRLCLPPERDDEVAEALGDRLAKRGELWTAGPPEQTVVTLWWDTNTDTD